MSVILLLTYQLILAGHFGQQFPEAFSNFQRGKRSDKWHYPQNTNDCLKKNNIARLPLSKMQHQKKHKGLLPEVHAETFLFE